MEQPSVAEEERVGSSDRMVDAQGTLPALEIVEEVAGTVSTVHAGLSTTVLLSDDRTKAVMPLL